MDKNAKSSLKDKKTERYEVYYFRSLKKYAIKDTSRFVDTFLDLKAANGGWGRDSEYFKDCLGSKKEIAKFYRKLNDRGEKVDVRILQTNNKKSWKERLIYFLEND